MRGPSFWTGAGALIGRRMGANSLLLREPSESGLSGDKSTPKGAQNSGDNELFTVHDAVGSARPLRSGAACGETPRMSEPILTSIDVGAGPAARRIAVRLRDGAGPGLFWLGGFRSDMKGTKAVALDAWAGEHGRACIRFDYSGHGESGGAFTDGTIGRWLEDS